MYVSKLQAMIEIKMVVVLEKFSQQSCCQVS